MLSVFEITIALIIGILWGLYLETKFLIITSVFLYFLVLMFYKKYNLMSIILLTIVIASCFYTKEKIENFDMKYLEDKEINMKITIITHLEESDYTYKYHGENQEGDKFVLYFKKSENAIFKVGDFLQIKGEFILPELERNRGGFNYRRYLNSNGIYGIVSVSSFDMISKEFKIMNLIYAVQNMIHGNFQSILTKENARSIKWDVNTVKRRLYQRRQKIIFKKLV